MNADLQQTTEAETASLDEHASASMRKDLARQSPRAARVCLIGMNNLSVLAPEYDSSVAAGEPVQQTLLAAALARRGHLVSMITADHGQPDGMERRGVLVYKAFDKKAGAPMVRFVHPRWTGLWSAMRRADADVYYASCAGGMLGQIAMFCRAHGKAFLFRVASDADCAPDTLLIRRWYWRDRTLYEYGLKRAAGVLAQSEKQRRLLRENFGVKSVVAPLLVESACSPRSFAERDIEALWVSNLRPLKRPDILMELARAEPRTSFHMVGGAGVGESQFFEATRLQASALPNVMFHGPLAYGEASALYSRARVFVNTSDIEGFPNTYLQAWASGAPVVAFFDPDGAISREGLGVAVRSLGEMVEAVRCLTSQENVWRATSARCLAFMQREYAEERVLAPYIRLIEQCRKRTEFRAASSDNN